MVTGNETLVGLLQPSYVKMYQQAAGIERLGSQESINGNLKVNVVHYLHRFQESEA